MQSLSAVLIVVSFICQAAETINLADVACGRPMVRRARIKGGEDAQVGEFPWLVSVRVNGGHFCGGTLISSKFVLTAAHCTFRRTAEQVTVGVGEHHLLKKENHGNEKVLTVTRIFNHKNFSKRYIDDIGLLELETPVEWTKFVRPLCLADSTVDASDTQLESKLVTVAGWGWTEEQANGGVRANIMQKATVRVIPRGTCQDWYVEQTGVGLEEPQAVKLFDTHLCAGDSDGTKDACRGDSGGPLMIKDTEGKFVNIGVVSAGIGCGRKKLPGLYTRTSKYTTWIQDTMKHAENTPL